VDGRERVGIHHDFTLYYLLNGIRGAKRLPTIFAPHVWLLRGKFEVTPPSIPPSPLPESVSCGFCCQACTSLLRKNVVFVGLLHTHLFYYKTVFIMAIDMGGKWYINADIYPNSSMLKCDINGYLYHIQFNICYLNWTHMNLFHDLNSYLHYK
jgi:hypothetical protein